MRSPSLTRRSEHEGGRLCHWYDWRGRSVLVCDSARNMLLVIELFADKELEPEDKFQILLAMLFPEPEKAIEAAGESLDDLIACVLWDACGLDVTGTKPHERAVFDWESDAPRIQASFMSAYGITWDQAADGLSFADVCALPASLSKTTAKPRSPRRSTTARPSHRGARSTTESSATHGARAAAISRSRPPTPRRPMPWKSRTTAAATCSPR